MIDFVVRRGLLGDSLDTPGFEKADPGTDLLIGDRQEIKALDGSDDSVPVDVCGEKTPLCSGVNFGDVKAIAPTVFRQAQL